LGKLFGDNLLFEFRENSLVFTHLKSCEALCKLNTPKYNSFKSRYIAMEEARRDDRIIKSLFIKAQIFGAATMICWFTALLSKHALVVIGGVSLAFGFIAGSAALCLLGVKENNKEEASEMNGKKSGVINQAGQSVPSKAAGKEDGEHRVVKFDEKANQVYDIPIDPSAPVVGDTK
jgi:hypothetical protein